MSLTVILFHLVFNHMLSTFMSKSMRISFKWIVRISSLPPDSGYSRNTTISMENKIVISFWVKLNLGAPFVLKTHVRGRSYPKTFVISGIKASNADVVKSIGNSKFWASSFVNV